MRKILVLISLCFVTLFSGYAQIENKMAEVLYPKFQLPMKSIEREASDYLLNQFTPLTLNENSLVLSSHQSSVLGHHLSFAHYHQGVRVYMSGVKINVGVHGNILSVVNNLKLFEGGAKSHTNNFKRNSMEPVYAIQSSSIEPMYILKQKDESGVFEELLINSMNEVVSKRYLDLFMMGKDTVIQTKIFNPDPLTSAGKLYGGDGGIWVNKNGQDYAEINAQRVSVPVTVGFSNDTFYTRSPYITLSDIESPAQAPYQSLSNNFDFTRSSSTFREMMALYHIETFRKYLSSIGYGLSNMFNTLVDISAYQGQDQSRFSFSGSKPALFFGTGGVPDAEDADVIIHEYTHAISFYLAPNTTSGSERTAVEEANCDFMACQYSKNLSNFNWRWVFNWDGHNVYWDGRDANSPNKYPKDLDADFYKSSVIWSSMLNDISLDLGRDVTTRILMASMSNYDNDLSMQQTADFLVQADSILYGMAHFGPIKTRLWERGFQVYLGLNSGMPYDNNIALINSEGFANGTGSLKVESHLTHGVSFELIDMQGKVILNQSDVGNSFTVSPQMVPMGMYLLKIISGDQVYSSKVVRFN